MGLSGFTVRSFLIVDVVCKGGEGGLDRPVKRKQRVARQRLRILPRQLPDGEDAVPPSITFEQPRPASTALHFYRRDGVPAVRRRSHIVLPVMAFRTSSL